MDYLITFEDGSDAYLFHYGVKGMKWRNRKIDPGHIMPSASNDLDGDRTLSALTGQDPQVNSALEKTAEDAKEFIQELKEFKNKKVEDAKGAKQQVDDFVADVNRVISNGKKFVEACWNSDIRTQRKK